MEKQTFKKTGSKDNCDLEWHLEGYKIQDLGIMYSIYFGDNFVVYSDKASKAKQYVLEQLRTYNHDAMQRIKLHGGS